MNPMMTASATSRRCCRAWRGRRQAWSTSSMRAKTRATRPTRSSDARWLMPSAAKRCFCLRWRLDLRDAQRYQLTLRAQADAYVPEWDDHIWW